MNFSDDSFAGDDQFSISESLDSYELYDNRDSVFDDEPTVSQADAAWGFCSSEEGLWIDNDIAHSDPELAARLTRDANSSSWNNQVTPESSRARLERKADELFSGQLTIMTSGYCGTVSIYCHECCDYYRLKVKTLLAGSSACQCTSDRNLPLDAHDTCDFAYPFDRHNNWLKVKRDVKQQQADERERKRQSRFRPVNRLEKWSNTVEVAFREISTTYEFCETHQRFFDVYLKSRCKAPCPCGDEE